MNTPIMVTLDRDAMSGYLLNVLGTDQIHDFCGSRLEGAKKNIIKIFSNANSSNNSKKSNRLKNGKTQTGGFPILIDLPTDSEFIEQQCLEIINIFVNTIIYENNEIDKNNESVLIVNGGQQTSTPQKNLSYNNYEKLTGSPTSVTEVGDGESYTDSNSDKALSNLFNQFNNEPEDSNDNVIIWGNHVKTNIKLFVDTSHNNINDYLNYICINDIINIFTSYLDKLPEINKSEDVTNFEYFNTLYVESMNYFISSMSISCSDNIQKGGETKIKKPFKSVISKMLKQMAFTFCDISNDYNCGDWKNSPNWECFEIGLLNNNISTVEKHSSDWIREHIISNKPKEYEYTGQSNKKQKLYHIVPGIKQLEGVFNVIGNLNCNLNPKTQKRHIINNSANLNEPWKQMVLNNYPSFIDSQTSSDEPLLEKMEIYSCGFQDPSNNYYIMNMNKKIDTHTIQIKCNNNKFEFTQICSNFNIYNKTTKKMVPATKWKDVTLCVALIRAFESISNTLTNKNITTLPSLIKVIEQQFTNTTNTTNTTHTNMIQLFYMFSLFKGLGDISQEMTSVIKYGGGNKNKISPKVTDNYEAFDNSGNALRFFLAGDILSANRFILTLNYGLEYGLKNRKDNNINSKAYGGYLHVYGCKSTDMYLVEANQPLQKLPTGGNKKHSRKYKNSKRKRKNHTKNTRNKHNKTYKLYKKNT